MFNIPKFDTHGTPINCSVRPLNARPSAGKGRAMVSATPTTGGGSNGDRNGGGGGSGGGGGGVETMVDSRCACTIL